MITIYSKKLVRDEEEDLTSWQASRQVVETILQSRDLKSALLNLRMEGIGLPNDMKAVLGIKDLIEMTRRQMRSQDAKKAEMAVLLESKLKRVFWDTDPGTISDEEIMEVLGEWALSHWLKLKNLPDLLRKWGFLTIDEDGQRYTDAAVRRLGAKILVEIFGKRGKGKYFGSHPSRKKTSSGGIKSGEVTKYEAGEPLNMNANRTIYNAVIGGGAGVPVRLKESDIAVDVLESSERASTALLVDRSVSMREGGKLVAAKKVAIALYALMQQWEPKDTLHLIGFCTRAHPLIPADLPNLRADDRNPYTNIHEALEIALRLLAPERNSRRQVILITDGEPTAHLTKGGVFFQSPPNRKTVTATLNAARKLTKRGIDLIVFMIGDDPSCRNFVSQMGKITKGRTFLTTPENLKECVLVDYVTRRASRL